MPFICGTTPMCITDCAIYPQRIQQSGRMRQRQHSTWCAVKPGTEAQAREIWNLACTIRFKCPRACSFEWVRNVMHRIVGSAAFHCWAVVYCKFGLVRAIVELTVMHLAAMRAGCNRGYHFTAEWTYALAVHSRSGGHNKAIAPWTLCIRETNVTGLFNCGYLSTYRPHAQQLHEQCLTSMLSSWFIDRSEISRSVFNVQFLQ